MNRFAILLASAAALVSVSPVAAQSMQGMDHSSMPKMGKPAKPKVEQAAPQPASQCTPEHAEMGHCVLEPASSAKPPSQAMPGMDMAAQEPAESDPDCPPEHAQMGHCTPKAMPSTSPNDANAVTGTDLPPGNAPAPASPSDWYADRLYPQPEMEASRREMMKENGGQALAFISFNLAEYQVRNGRDGFRWDGEGWYGGDISRVTVKSEGEGAFGEGIEEAEVQLLYSRAIGPYFNLQAGVRQDLGPGPKRTYATVGFEGLAPYWLEVEGALFLSNKGDLLGRLEGYYDQRITQRLILQPRVEANFADRKSVV